MSSFSKTYRSVMTVQGNTIREQKITQTNQTYDNTFKESFSYYPVIINNISYDTQIFNIKAFKNINSIKNIQFAPYQDINNIFAGQYITWTDDSNITSTWIITSFDRRSPQKPMAQIEKCNTDIKWIDENGEKQYQKCVFRNKFSSEEPTVGNDVKTNEGQVLIITQLNEKTSNIDFNQSFIFGGNNTLNIKGQKYKQIARRYEQNDYNINEKILLFVLEKTNNNLESDDLYNNYTDIYKEKSIKVIIEQDNLKQIVGSSGTLSYIVLKENVKISKNVIWESSNDNICEIDSTGNYTILSTGNIVITCKLEDNTLISDSIEIDCVSSIDPSQDIYSYIIKPEISIIKKGYEQIFSVYEYKNGILQNTKFNIVPTYFTNYSNYFSIYVIDDISLESCNKFKLININQYTLNNLEIKIYNESELVKTMLIRLGGII